MMKLTPDAGLRKSVHVGERKVRVTEVTPGEYFERE